MQTFTFRRNNGTTFAVQAAGAAQAMVKAQSQHDQAEADKRKAADLMTPAQLNQLRASYAGIHGIDPCGDAYPKLIALLDASGQERLKQLAGAGIKFVSKLAANRVKREG